MGAELPYVPCCNESCFDKLKDFIGLTCFQNLQDQGMFEYSSILGRGLVCKLLDIAEKYNIKGPDFYDILYVIVDKGVVAHCSPDGLKTIASVETFLEYADSMGWTQQAAVPA
jgi:hypothetical protein